MASVIETNNTSQDSSDGFEKETNEDSADRFDIHVLHNSLRKCCTDNESLIMELYLIAFRELYRFFSLLGSVFGFVASDILSKVEILEEYLLHSSKHYATIQGMLEHEISNSSTADPKKPSGARTLLRLHRSLEFIMSFMQDFGSADSSAKSSAIAQRCYKETLAKHHPWLVQKGAIIAMYTLPAKRQFIEKVKGETCDEEAVKYYGQLMGDIATASRKLYDATQKLYEANGLLDLP